MAHAEYLDLGLSNRSHDSISDHNSCARALELGAGPASKSAWSAAAGSSHCQRQRGSSKADAMAQDRAARHLAAHGVTGGAEVTCRLTR